MPPYMLVVWMIKSLMLYYGNYSYKLAQLVRIAFSSYCFEFLIIFAHFLCDHSSASVRNKYVNKHIFQNGRWGVH